MSHVQRGLASALPMSNEVMQDAYGWNRGADMRVGKTARERESGQHANYLANREARRDDNRRAAGTLR